MLKKTLYGNAARAAVLSGIRKIAAAVKVTLGPKGRNILISQSMVIDYGTHNLPIRVSKDGYTVSKSFEINDNPFEQAGVLAFKECVQKTVDEAGDGTTTTGILMEAIVEKGIALVNAGVNPMELSRGIDAAVDFIVNELFKVAVPIKGNIDRIREIATVSANNDTQIGNWIAKAFEKIGSEGVIDLEASKGINTEIKLSDGYKWENGWISPHFVTNREKQIVEFIDPLILLYEKRITHHTQVQKALEICMQNGKPVLIVCEDADEEGLAFLAMNTLQRRIQCCVVKSPSFGNDRRLQMEDLAVLTGGTYISDSKGVGIKEIDIDHFGSAKKVIVSREETIIIGGDSDKLMLEELLNELRTDLAEAKNEDEKSPIEKRIAKITGSVAVIQVGATTETEMKEKLDRFDDAVRAVKAAISEGYTVGSGTSLLRIQNDTASGSQGWDLIFSVLDEPLKQICKNAGVYTTNKSWWEFWRKKSILQKVLDECGNVGYNAKTGEIENLELSGIIDPIKVVRSALQNAASSAKMILTSEALICDTL